MTDFTGFCSAKSLAYQCICDCANDRNAGCKRNNLGDISSDHSGREHRLMFVCGPTGSSAKPMLERCTAKVGFSPYGVLELRLYVKRRQGNHFKYNARFPADHPSDVFWFRSQGIDNALRTFLSGLPIWTAYEVLLLWSWANNIGPWGAWSIQPIWLAAFALLLPLAHEAHFYFVHRLIHLPFLYKWVHSVHHNSINPSPWSSLSMHPVEHLLYWSGTLIHLIVPSHPLLVLYHLQISGTGAVIGHIGFDKIEFGERGAMDTHAYRLRKQRR